MAANTKDTTKNTTKTGIVILVLILFFLVVLIVIVLAMSDTNTGKSPSDCKPTDAWELIRGCRNPGPLNMTCRFEQKVGTSSPRPLGDNDRKMLEQKFKSQIGKSPRTSFDWGQVLDRFLFEPVHSVGFGERMVPPRRAFFQYQVVGHCGDTTIRLQEYKAEIGKI